jgi:hypothetical protein
MTEEVLDKASKISKKELIQLIGINSHSAPFSSIGFACTITTYFHV